MKLLTFIVHFLVLFVLATCRQTRRWSTIEMLH